MKTLIITENQIKKVIDRIINEQAVSEFYGGTDAQRITHALLSKKFGLPDGAQNESKYYGANVADVVNISATGDESKFLSVFKPANEYSKDPNFYYDFIQVNNEKLENSGTKTFNFTKGNVYATHNGLLAIKRAMDHMGGKAGMLTISFGTNKAGEQAQGERIGGGVQFDSDRAMNQTPSLNMLEEFLVAFASSPKFRQIGTFVSVKKDASDEELISILKNIINNIGNGTYGFMDTSKRDDIIKNLTPKGFVPTTDFDVTPFVQKLKMLQSIDDLEIDYGTGKAKIYNTNKQNQIGQIGTTFEEKLIESIKTTYIKNFEIYVQNYLPNSASKILPMIKNVRFVYSGLNQTHYRVFHSVVSSGSQTSSTINQKNTTYKTGN